MLPVEISLQVVGVFSSSINLYISDLILVNTYDAQRALLSSRAPAATDLCVYLKDPSLSNSIASEIVLSFPELRVLTQKSIVAATETTYGLRGGFATIMWFTLLATVVLIAWNQTSTVGQDSKREVGILKTLGFGTLDILEIRLIESVILGFVSASIGTFLAVVYDVYLGAPFLRDLMLGWSASFPSFTLPLEISASRLMMLYAVAVRSPLPPLSLLPTVPAPTLDIIHDPVLGWNIRALAGDDGERIR